MQEDECKTVLHLNVLEIEPMQTLYIEGKGMLHNESSMEIIAKMVCTLL